MTDEAILQRENQSIPTLVKGTIAKDNIVLSRTNDAKSENGISEVPVTEEQVADFLKHHPEFFLHWESILLKLTIPHHTGGAISLVERQVAILRDRNMDLRNRFCKLIDAATENDQLYSHTTALTLSLLEVDTLAGVIEQLQHSFKNEFKVDAIALLLHDNYAQWQDCLHHNGIARCVSQSETNAALSGLLQDGKIVCGTLREAQANFIFNHSQSNVIAKTIGSAAIIPLHYKGELGLLAVGSYDDNHFVSNMGTLFIKHIGEVLSRVIHPYLTPNSD